MEDVREHRPSPILLMAHLKGSGAVVRMIKFSQDVAVLQGSCQPGSNGRVKSQGGRAAFGSLAYGGLSKGAWPRQRASSQNNSSPLFRNHFSFRLFQSALPCSACPRRPSCCSHRQSRDAQRLHHRSSAVRAWEHENLCRIDAARRCQIQFLQFQFAAWCSDCPNTSPLQFQQLQ
jgi:hypothetical protein